MPDDVRIGVEPPAPPPARSSRILVVAAVLVLLAAAGAWLAGVFSGDTTTTTGADITFTTTTTTPATTTTLPLEERLAAAALFWDASRQGRSGGGRRRAFPEAGPAAVDLMGFVAAFHPGFIVGRLRRLRRRRGAVHRDRDQRAPPRHRHRHPRRAAPRGPTTAGSTCPPCSGSAAARLSLYALDAHTEEVRAACPVTDNPQVPRLAIVGSATAECGAYLAGLIPEYLSGPGFDAGPRE